MTVSAIQRNQRLAKLAPDGISASDWWTGAIWYIRDLGDNSPDNRESTRWSGTSHKHHIPRSTFHNEHYLWKERTSSLLFFVVIVVDKVELLFGVKICLFAFSVSQIGILHVSWYLQICYKIQDMTEIMRKIQYKTWQKYWEKYITRHDRNNDKNTEQDMT